MREVGKAAARVYTMIRIQSALMARNRAKVRKPAIKPLYQLVLSARNRAFYGWARADLNHRIPGVPDDETELNRLVPI
jgi:hypothetical protein